MSQPSNHFPGYLEGVMTSGKMGMSTLASENNSYGTGIDPNRVSQQMNFSRQSSSPVRMLTQLSMDMEMSKIVDKLNMNMGHCYTKILSPSCDKTFDIPTCPES